MRLAAPPFAAAAAALLLAVAAAFGFDSKPLADPSLQSRYLRLTGELRCLVCQNQSIADSNADLAADMRQVVRQMLVAGAADDDIIAFMTNRYGDFVRYRPPFAGGAVVLWLAPFALAAAAAFGVLRRRRRGGETLTAADRAAAERLLRE